MARGTISAALCLVSASAFSTEVDTVHKPKPARSRKTVARSWSCNQMPSHDHPCDEPPSLSRQSFENAMRVDINGEAMFQARDFHHVKAEQFHSHANSTTSLRGPAPVDDRGCPTCPAVFLKNKGDIHQDCRCWDLTSAAAVRKFRWEAQLWNSGHSGASYCSCPVDNNEVREGWGTNCANREPVPGKLVRGSMRTYLASKTSACGCCCRLVSQPFIQLEERCRIQDEPEQTEEDQILAEDPDGTPSVANGGRRMMRKGLSLMQIKTDVDGDHVDNAKKKNHRKFHALSRTEVRFIDNFYVLSIQIKSDRVQRKFFRCWRVKWS